MAARSLKTCPEIEARIRDGKISLSTAAMFQNFVKTERVEKPRILLQSIEGLSNRETEKVFASISPTYIRTPPEKTIAINAEDVEIRFVADKALQKKFEALRNTFSHIEPKLDYQKLFHLILDRLLGKSKQRQSATALKTPPEKLEKNENLSNAKTSTLNSILDSTLPAEQDLTSQSTSSSNSRTTTRNIPAHIRRNVFKRDLFQCTYKDRETGRKCGSKFQVELDHIVPYSMGGKHTEENLQLRCACHNRLAAIKAFGQKSAKFGAESMLA